MRNLNDHLSYANVVSTLCLFLVLGGGAYAAATISGRDIVDNSVGSADLRNNGIRGKDIGNGTITTGDVKDGSLLAIDFKPGLLPASAAGSAGQPGTNGSSETAEQLLTKLETIDGSGSGVDADLLDGQDGSAFVTGEDDAGGDLVGTFSNLQIAPDTIGRSELGIAPGLGCCVTSFFEFEIPANGCHTKILGLEGVAVGEIYFAYPETDLGTGVYLRPTIVAHPGEVIFEICNATGSGVKVPFGTFFLSRLIH
jgi:hypothetical protein